MPTRQDFKTTDRLRLEIGRPPTTGLRNLIRNPSGERGAWGWHVTDSGTLSSNRSAKDYRPGGTLTFSSVAAVATGVVTRFESEAWAIAPGQFAGGSFWLVTAASAGTIVSYRLVMRDASGAEVYTGSPNTTGTAGSKYGVPTTAAAPAGAVSVHLRFEMTNPGTAIRSFDFREATLVVGASGAAVNSPDFTEPLVWTNVLEPALNIEVDRTPLGLGILSARIRSASLDPAVDNLVRPGRPIRLMAYSTEPGWEPLFWGKIQDGRTSYDLAYPVASKRALIEISATDAADELANTSEPTSHRQMRSIRNKIRDTGVPFEIDNSTDNKAETDTIVATNDNASVLDQIALTRDTTRGRAAVTRYGVLRAIDRQYLNGVDNQTTSPFDPDVATFTTADYNADAVIDYDTRRLVNTVLIRCLYVKEDGTTTDGIFGPYVDTASVQEWGAFQSTYTIAGTESEAGRLFRAGEILKETAVPTRRISQITFPVHNGTTQFHVGATNERRVHLDLLDRVVVQNPTAGISGVHRVAGIKHTITPNKWLVRVSFGSEAGTPPARSQAPLPASLPTMDAPYTGVTLNPAYLTHSGAFTVATRRNGFATLDIEATASVAAVPGGGALFLTLPAGFAPSRRKWFSVRTAGGADYTLLLNTNGTVTCWTGIPITTQVLGTITYPL